MKTSILYSAATAALMFLASCIMSVSCNKVDGAPENPGTGAMDEFSLSVDDISVASAECHVVPKDGNMTYIAMVKPRDEVDAFVDDESLTENDFAYFQSVAEMFAMTVEELLPARYFRQGSYDFKPTGLEPESEYCLYVYGAEIDGTGMTVTTGVYREYFTTEKPEAPAEGFKIDIELNGAKVLMVVTPADNDVLYYRDMVRDDQLEAYPGSLEEKIEAFAKEYIEGYLIMGISIDKIGKKGPQSYQFNNLWEETLYYAFAYELNDDGSAAGKVYYEEVMTGTNQ